MNTMSDTPINSNSLSYRLDGYDYTLTVDGESLSVEWQSPGYSRATKTSLRDLKPELPIERWASSGAEKKVRVAVPLLIAGVVVTFSDIRVHVPLLAPALLVFGLHSLYLGVRGYKHVHKTVIYTKHGKFIAAIPHVQELEAQRLAFEKMFVSAVKKAREDEDAA
jgi:hypothetical protein